jgi:hypothetical protein
VLRDVRGEYKLGLGKLSWTSIFLGCLENKDYVCRFDVKPRLRIVALVDRRCQFFLVRMPFSVEYMWRPVMT